jgi:hypothetical protein
MVRAEEGMYARVKITDSRATFPELDTDMPVTFVYKYTTDTRYEGRGSKRAEYCDTGWWPWVIIAESTVLREYGIRGELGLYAWKGFAKGGRANKCTELGMGKKTGDVIGDYREDANKLEAMFGYENIGYSGFTAEEEATNNKALGKKPKSKYPDTPKYPTELNSDHRTHFDAEEKTRVQAALVKRVESNRTKWNKVFVLNEPGGGFAMYDGNTPAHLWSYANSEGRQSNMNVSKSGVVSILKPVPPLQLDKSLAENKSSELTIGYGKDFWKLHAETGNPPRKPSLPSGSDKKSALRMYPEPLDLDHLVDDPKLNHLRKVYGSQDLDVQDLNASAARGVSIVDVTVGAYIRAHALG